MNKQEIRARAQRIIILAGLPIALLLVVWNGSTEGWTFAWSHLVFIVGSVTALVIAAKACKLM